MDITSRQFDVFVVFAAADRPWVEGYLLDALGRAGVRLQTEDGFQPGTPRVIALEQAVAQSEWVVLVVSRAYSEDGLSDFAGVLGQSRGLQERQWPLVPVLLDDGLELPTRVAALQSIDASRPELWSAAVERLCQLLQRPVPAPTPPPTCPYPGLRPFAVGDRTRFFGRSSEVSDLRLRVFRQRRLFVIGPSGSGKSSLVFAGLVARLGADFDVRSLRPGTQAADAAALARERPSRLLLVVDQLEELFTQVDDDVRAEFMAALDELRGVDSCTVVLTMRADFFGELIESEFWPVENEERVEIAPLRGEALREAIVRPAREAGVQLEPELVERLFADTADEPGVLPLLQETMVVLWERMERRLLTRRSYEALGSDGRSGIAVALARRADAALEGPPRRAELARRIFLRLVQFGEGRADTRRQQREADLRSAQDDPAEVAEVLQHLASYRMITLGGEEEGGRTVDLAHEALLTAWPTLHRWIDERRSAEQTRRRLEAQTADWFEGRSGLLDDLELAEAEAWLATPDAAVLGVPERLPELIAATQEARAAARRRARRLRMSLAALVVVFLLVAAALTGWALWQQRQAQRNERTATARALASGALAQLDVDPELSLLLALAAAENGESAQATDALRQALLRPYVGVTMRPGTPREASPILGAAVSPDGSLIATAHEGEHVARVWDARTGRLRHVLRGHRGNVAGVLFSPRGDTIATFSASGESDVTTDRTARLWSSAKGRQLAVLRGHADVEGAAFDHAGRRVVTWGGANGSARLWAAPWRRPLRTVGGAGVTSVAFSPDDEKIITGTLMGRVALWNASTGALITTVQRRAPETVYGVVWAGRTAAAVFGDGTRRAWDAATGDALFSGTAHDGVIRTAAVDGQGRRIVTGGDDGVARVWDATTGRLLAEMLGHTGGIGGASFSSDGRMVVTSSDDKTARVWDASTGAQLAVLRGHESDVSTAQFVPRTSQVVTSSLDGAAKLWDVRVLVLHGGAQAEPTILIEPGHVVRATFARGGAATTVGRNGATVWSTTTGRRVRTFDGSVVLARDGRHAVTSEGRAVLARDGRDAVTSEGRAVLWDVVAGKELGSLGTSTSAAPMAFSPSGGRVAIADGENIRFFATRSRQPLGSVRIPKLDAEFGAVAFTTDGNLAAVADQETGVFFYNVATGASRGRLRKPAGFISDMEFTPDRRYLITGSEDAGARLWSTRTGKLVAPLGKPSGFVLDVDVDPQGRLVATTTGTFVHVFELPSGRSVAEMPHGNTVASVDFDPDGRLIATGSYDGSMRVWEAETGVLVAAFPSFAEEVEEVVFSPDGRAILGTSQDQTTRIYRCDGCGTFEELRAIAQRRVTRALTEDERTRFAG